MNSKIYRCGWCGMPTDYNGIPLDGEKFHKASKIINKYGDKKTYMSNGICCEPLYNERRNRATKVKKS